MSDSEIPLIFLDIDGVLNDHSFVAKAESNDIDRACVGHLNAILEATGAAIVLSSAWRYMILNGAMTILGFEYMLRTHGVHCVGRLIGHTVADEEIEGRASQINQWRYANGHRGPYVVIDDMDLGFTDLGLPWVETVGGLRGRDVEEVVNTIGVGRAIRKGCADEKAL